MEDDLRPRLVAEPSGEARQRALRGFGIGLGVILSFFSWRSYRHGGDPIPLLIGAAVSWTLAGLFPAAFGPIFGPWMKVVGVLARINLWLICGFIYYVIMTPYAIVLRAFGVRPLELALREKDSYWDEKPPRDPAESARRSF